MFRSLSGGLDALLTTLVIAAIVVVLLFVVGAVAFYVIFKKPPVFKEAKPNKLMGKDFPALAKRTEDDMKIMKALPYRNVTVTTDDGCRLSGCLFINKKTTDITVLCIHGYNSDGWTDYSTKGLAFLEAGYNVFIVSLRHCRDKTGEGKYIGFGALEKNDIIKFVEYLNTVWPKGKIFIHGTSMGGATVMQASSHDLTPNVRGIIDDCGFTSAKEEMVFQLHTTGHIPAFPILNIVNIYCRLFAHFDLSSSNSRDEVKKATVPILFIHGDADAFVPVKMGRECYEACASPKELYIVPGAAHAAAYVKDSEKYMQTVNSFIEKYSWDNLPAGR